MTCNVPTADSDFANASEIIDKISGDNGDPTLDEYEENIANGNNSAHATGIQLPTTRTGQPPVQTTLPTTIPLAANIVNSSPAPGGNGVAVPAGTWNGTDYDVLLSPNFKLRAFTIGTLFPYPLTDYNSTYTAQVRFSNLTALAVNVAEPLLAKFGPFNINSGIRNKTSTATGISQHITGQAIDVQFSGWTYARYWENAAWIKDNIKYDQFIYEHSDTTGLVWYHLSFNSAGNRSPDVRTKVMTMYRNNYDSGLKNYG